jgi:hypothetical protein
MARLQILELPMVHNGDQSETPFVLVVDQMPADEAAFEALRRDLSDDVAQRIGARAVLAFETTVDIPANDVTAPLDDAFKAEVQQWAAGTNETITRLVEALSDPRKRPKRDGQETRLKLDDHEIRNAVPADARKMREQTGLD